MEQPIIKILVCCHKKDIMMAKEPYMPIQVGKVLHPDLDLAVQGDNIGENISEKNPCYCELTGLYWAWKNLEGVDYIGLCHYRRYFDFYKQVPSFLPNYFEKTESFRDYDFSLSDKIMRALRAGKVVVPCKQVQRESLITQYCLHHISDDLRILRDVIEEHSEKRYIKAFNNVMYGNKYSPYNMFIMPWAIFSDYCDWLFDVLQKVENRTDISNYNPVQKRIFGYMSERLLNVYLSANDISEYKVPVVTFDDSKTCLNDPLMNYTIKTCLKNILFKMALPPIL